MTRKKVVDILPPKEYRGKETKDFLPKEIPQPQFKKPEVKTSRPTINKSLIFTLFVLVLGGSFCYFYLSKAEIEVWPETENVAFDTKLTVNKDAEKADFSAKVIPGIVFEREKTVSGIFPATGKTLEETKAEGTIRVYNNYSVSPQVLIANTRFVSTDGKIFRTPIKVTIPGGNYEKGKFVPGEIDIKVEADQPGSDYNIGPTTFSIPGFAGTEKYTKFYAKSTQPMTGGVSQETPQVTKADIDQAEDSLVDRAKLECEDSFRKELESEEFSSKYIFLKENIQTEIIEKFSSAKPREEVKDFNSQVKAKSKTLIFKKEDFENFSKDFVLAQVPEGKKLYEESLKIGYLPETINLDSGKIILSLKILAKIYPDIDILALKNNLKGKSLSESQILLESQPKITKVTVKFWPFWVKKVPQDMEKVEFKLNLNPAPISP